jgi:WhiB family redox-sensing transcriptional regulator
MGRTPHKPRKPVKPGAMLWADDAACKNTPIEMWFNDFGCHTDADALRMCRRCPVMNNCRKYAIDNSLTDGIWGGLTPDQRKTYTKRLKAKL